LLSFLLTTRLTRVSPAPPPHRIHLHPTPPSLHSFPTRRSSDLRQGRGADGQLATGRTRTRLPVHAHGALDVPECQRAQGEPRIPDRKSTRLNSSHEWTSYAVFCLKEKTTARARGST